MHRSRRSGCVNPIRHAGFRRSLTDAELHDLAPYTDVVRVNANETLARAGRSAREFLLVLDGVVEITDAAGSTTPAGGGTVIGAAELVGHRPHTVTVVTRCVCTVVVVYGPAYTAIAGMHPVLH